MRFRIIETATFLICVALSHTVRASESNSPPKTPAQLCAQRCGTLPCTFLQFEGFAPHGKLAGYARIRCPGAQGKGEAERTWYVKSVNRSRIGPIKPHNRRIEDARYPDWFRKEKFLAKAVTGEPIAKGHWEFLDTQGRRYRIYLRTEKKIAWYFEVTVGTKTVLSYRGAFDEIYFDLRPRLFLSSDGRKAAVLLDLDAMIHRDSGVMFFSLPPTTQSGNRTP